MFGKELILNIGSERVEVFLESGFFCGMNAPSPIHKHRYTEIHLTEKGEIPFYVEGKKYVSSAGCMSVIPAGAMHRFPDIPKDSCHFTFFINYQIEDFKQFKLPKEILTELRSDAQKYFETGRASRLSKYIVFLCKDICESEPDLLPLCDREYIIQSFFASNYHISTVKLEDLAELLTLSHKQTERLVKQYTGNSFSKELTRVRVEAAKMLLRSDEALTLSEVAQLVGYNSYSGFWKAFKAR